MKNFSVQVNPCLEFMNGILLTSRYNELTIPYIGYGLMTEEINKYTQSLKEFFKPYGEEPIYSMIEQMIPNGFTFSRPVELMLGLGNSNNFVMQFPLSDLCIQYCEEIECINTLLKILKSFESKIGFFNYFETIKSFYDPIISNILNSLSEYPFIELLEMQFGKKQNSYNYVLSSLMIGSFGISFIDQKSLKADMFSVFATDNFSLSPAILFHEYSHLFINPLTDIYIDIVKTYTGTYEKLQKNKLPAYGSGYGDFNECINEHFVRAMTIHLLKKLNLNDMATENLKNDLYRGYKYIPAILEKYNFYDVNRDKYSDFNQFYLELLKVFECDKKI